MGDFCCHGNQTKRQMFLLNIWAKLGIRIGSGQMDGSWFLATNPVWTVKDTDPSDWLNLKWFESIARAWILLHILAVVRAKRNAVFNITWSLEALCKGTYGAFCRQTKTKDKSHLGIRDLCTGKMYLLQRLDCPELGTHKVEACDSKVSETDPDWDSWTFGKLHLLSIDPMPTLFWLFCRFSITCLPKHWICLGYDKSWWQYDVLGTIGGPSIPLHIGWENVFLLACWYMRPLLCCR